MFSDVKLAVRFFPVFLEVLCPNFDNYRSRLWNLVTILVKPHFPSCSFIFPYSSSLNSWISFVQGWNSAPLGVLRWRSCRPMAAHNSASFVRQKEGRLGLGCGSPSEMLVNFLCSSIKPCLSMFVLLCSIGFLDLGAIEALNKLTVNIWLSGSQHQLWLDFRYFPYSWVGL